MAEFGIEAATSDEGFRRSLIYYCGLLLHYGWVRTGLGGLNMGQALQIGRQIRQYDLVFATTDSVGLALEMLTRLGYITAPIVHASMGLIEKLVARRNSLGFRITRGLLDAAARIVCYTQPALDGLCSLMSQPRHKLDFVHFGVDSAFFSPCSDVADAGFILSVGIDLRRDWNLLLEVAGRIGGRFEVVCRPDALRGRSVPSNVHVQCGIPIFALRALYAQASALVVTVQEESQDSGQTVILEAMAMGKAVIATRTAAFEGYSAIQDGKHCLFVPAGDAASLESAIHRLRRDSELRHYLGTNARQVVEEHYNSRAYASQLARVFHTVGDRASQL
jgi:glycosyltransferase involved in cell wall biosynthesis